MKNIIKELLPYVLILGGVILIRTLNLKQVFVGEASRKHNYINGN